MENIGFLLSREAAPDANPEKFQARSRRANSATDLRRSFNDLQRYDGAEKRTHSRPRVCNRRSVPRDYVIKIWVPAFTVVAGPRDRVIPIGDLPKWLPITQIHGGTWFRLRTTLTCLTTQPPPKKDTIHNNHDSGCNYGCKSRAICYLILIDPSQFLDSLNGSSTGAEQMMA